jgi:hypothetical protein
MQHIKTIFHGNLTEREHGTGCGEWTQFRRPAKEKRKAKGSSVLCLLASVLCTAAHSNK